MESLRRFMGLCDECGAGRLDLAKAAEVRLGPITVDDVSPGLTRPRGARP